MLKILSQALTVPTAILGVFHNRNIRSEDLEVIEEEFIKSTR